MTDDSSELGSLLGRVESVELKLTVDDSDHHSAVRALGLDPLAAQLRQVFFFDTDALGVDGAGLIVRARRRQGEPDDSVVKLRPVVPDELPKRVRRLAGFSLELDVTPHGHVCSASVEGAPRRAHIHEVATKQAPVQTLFSKAQRAFFSEHAPEGLELDTLEPLGPILVLRQPFVPHKRKRREWVAELWLYPDGSRLLELSTKCKPADVDRLIRDGRALVTDHDIDLSEEQETKTRTTLEYFAGLAREPSPAS